MDIDGYQKCRSTLWDKGGIDGRTREAQIKAGAQPGTTDATYTIDLKLSSLVPGFIEKALAEQSLPGLLANFKARAEKLHGKG